MRAGSTSLEAEFRRKRRRLTPQRALICRLLDGNTAHPSAEVLHRRAMAAMPTLSLRTVYAVLHELVEIGAIQSLDLGTGSTRFDPNPQPHQHAVCIRCGRVVDVHVPVYPGEFPPDQWKGFSVRGVDLTFRGLCPDCRR